MERQLKLPAANEFSPGQFPNEGADALFELLAIVKDGSGDQDDLAEVIRTRWFLDSASKRSNSEERLQQQTKRANNVLTGMRQYGLVDGSKRKQDIRLSELGNELLELETDRPAARARFAQFLLRERYGLELLDAARFVRSSTGTISKKGIDEELERRGFSVSTNSSYSNKLRLWLEPSGVVDSAWNIDEARLAELSGVASSDVMEWRMLTAPQRAVLQTLRARAESDRSPISSHDLVSLLRVKGIPFDSAQISRQIYGPLHDHGWIHHDVTRKGRGGKGGLISLTPKALDLDAELIDGLQLGNVPADLRAHLARPLTTVMTDLASPDTGTKGIALELLALKICADAALTPVQLRLRGVETGGGEVDLVAEGAHLHFSRWLVQCKNQTAPVSLSVLAKEIGMATLLRAQVVVLVTTGEFANTVRRYARQAAETTAVQVILLDGHSLENYRKHGGAGLRAELTGIARATLSLKRHQLAEVPLA